MESLMQFLKMIPVAKHTATLEMSVPISKN